MMVGNMLCRYVLFDCKHLTETDGPKVDKSLSTNSVFATVMGRGETYHIRPTVP